MKTVVEIEQYLEQYVANASKYTGKDITVDRMWHLLELVGSPEKKLKVVHIAGTSGKTSTAYYVAELLKTAGNRVGLTVSPHVSSLTERLQIDGNPITEQQFCELFSTFIQLTGEQKDASYFEMMIVFILWSFVQLGVDYAVVETGLGGLHDSTNVLQRADKVCIITDIGLDHQHVLGDTIEEIAAQKAGIIHESNHVFAYDQGETVMRVLKAQCRDTHAELDIAKVRHIMSCLPLFQQRNWQLAFEVYQFIAKRDKLPELNDEQLLATQIAVPGRMQKVMLGKQLFVLDGAHNAQKMSAFIESFKQIYPNQKVPILLAMKRGKDYEEVVEILAPIVSSVVCAEFQTHQDLPIHAVPATELARACKLAGINDISIHTSIDTALANLVSKGNQLNLITGSFYLIGDALQLLEEKHSK